MVKQLLRRLLARSFYREGATRKILLGPCKGLRYRIFPGYGLSPIRGGWEPEAQALMVKYIAHDAIVYDVGANYGIHTLLMARLTTSGHVYAFEPLPDIYAELRDNINLNRFRNVTCVRTALSDRSGHAEFTRGHHGGAGHLREVGPLEGETISVTTISMDEFAFKAGNRIPNFLKIDVEGAESRVLLGATRILREARPTILLDLHTPEEDVAVGRVLLENDYCAYRTQDGQRVERLDKGWPDPAGLWGQFIAFPCNLAA